MGKRSLRFAPSGILLLLGWGIDIVSGIPDWVGYLLWGIAALWALWAIWAYARGKEKQGAEKSVHVATQSYTLPIKLDEDWIETRVQLKLHDWVILGMPIAPPHTMTGDVHQKFRRQAVDEWKREHGYPVEGNNDTTNPRAPSESPEPPAK